MLGRDAGFALAHFFNHSQSACSRSVPMAQLAVIVAMAKHRGVAKSQSCQVGPAIVAVSQFHDNVPFLAPSFPRKREPSGSTRRTMLDSRLRGNDGNFFLVANFANNNNRLECQRNCDLLLFRYDSMPPAKRIAEKIPFVPLRPFARIGDLHADIEIHQREARGGIVIKRQ